jgi:putative addiction module killer protein
MEVKAYVDRSGINHFERWLNKLKTPARAKVIAALARLELGNLSNVKWFAGIGEYRINWGPGLRIYLTQAGDDWIILFSGGDKDTQQHDIAKAKRLLKEYNEDKSCL